MTQRMEPWAPRGRQSLSGVRGGRYREPEHPHPHHGEHHAHGESQAPPAFPPHCRHEPGQGLLSGDGAKCAP
jgi:hypothetical protein